MYRGSPHELRAVAAFLADPGRVDEVDAATLRSLPPAALRSVVSDVAWRSRAAGEAVPSVGTLPAREPWQLRAHYWFVGQRLRFDFKFDQVGALVWSWERAVGLEDAMMSSLAAFAMLGRRHSEGVERWAAALAMPDAEHRSRHVCLAAMWSAHHLPDQGHRLRALCDDMVHRGEADANVYFRRASAHRKLREFDRALDDVDAALDLLGPGADEVNQDYLRERELIGLAMSFPY